jgi:hypothetical protein
MKDLPTAEEVIAKIVKFESTNDTIECTVYSLSQLMIEFAKLHVEKALKNASEDVELETYGNFGNSVNKDSILNSYPLENIK